MKEMLTGFTREEVQGKLHRLEPAESQSERIAEELGTTVFDQPEACMAVARRLNMFEHGLQDPNRPLGILYFLGQSGVGKTEMARAVADYMFADPDSERVKVLNMSDYAEHHYASRLIGSPPSYVGYNEQPAIPHDWLHKGRSIVVFDEIEKAHPEVHRALLSVMDKGVMDSRNGQKGTEPLNFQNSLIIFTSNVASGEIGDILSGKDHKLGFGSGDARDRESRVQDVAKKGLKAVFAPEFLARIDDTVIFKPLEKDSTKTAILNKFIQERNKHLSYIMGINAPYVDLTQEAKQDMVTRAKEGGGRGIKRLLEQEIFDRMADVMSSVDFSRRPFVADIEDGETVWYTDDPDPIPEAEPVTDLIPLPEVEAEEKPVEPVKRIRKKKTPEKETSPTPDKPDDIQNYKDLMGDQLFSMIPGTGNGKLMDIYVSIRDEARGTYEEATVYNISLGEGPLNE